MFAVHLSPGRPARVLNPVKGFFLGSELLASTSHQKAQCISSSDTVFSLTIEDMAITTFDLLPKNVW